MLSQLLPGLRDFRTPLVTGLLYLAAAWLWFGTSLLPEADAASDLERRLAELLELDKQVAGLTTLLFVAYLVGSITMINTVPVEKGPPIVPSQASLRSATLQWASRVMTDMPSAITVPRSQISSALWFRAVRGLGVVKSGPDSLKMNWVQFRIMCHWSVETDRLLLEMRLAQAAPARYDEYDRKQSEAALRLSMVVPLVLMISALVRDLPIVLLGLVVPAVLVLQGIGLLARARLVIVTALLNDVIASPTVQAAVAATERGQ